VYGASCAGISRITQSVFGRIAKYRGIASFARSSACWAAASSSSREPKYSLVVAQLRDRRR
jgi:hypothetical protein